MYLTTQDGNPLLRCLSPVQLSNGPLFDSHLRQLIEQPEGTWIKYQSQHNTIQGIYESVSLSNWKICAFIPTSYLLKPVEKFRDQVIMITIIVVLITFLLSIWQSNHSAKRIVSLSKNLQKVVDGNFSAYILVDSEDEIGILQQQFNAMLKTIQNHVSEQYELAQALKNQELVALQSQINPHFLYNTLDMIYWAANKDNNERIATITNNLASYYRLSLNQGTHFVSLEKEIEHVAMYLSIQNYRFENRIKFVTHIDNSLLPKMVLKLLLQPLVENAVIHGIMEKPEKSGTIVLTIKKCDRKILFELFDDGVGFVPDELFAQKAFSPSAKQSYGIWNINERLHLYYGSNCNLCYTSAPGQGTTVTFFIPLEEITGD